MKKLLFTVELWKEVKLGILDTRSESPGSVRTESREPEAGTRVYNPGTSTPVPRPFLFGVLMRREELLLFALPACGQR